MKHLSLYNTLTRTTDSFRASNPPVVTLYSCGPTVYDYAHIGNMRSYLFVDLLRRTLAYAGYEVRHAMNITDVGHLVGDSDAGEDKLEVGAAREGIHPLEVAKKYEEAFFEDLDHLNIERPTVIKRASEAVEEQIQLIQELEAKGFTYQTESAIYFDTARWPEYGKLTGQKLEEKLAGAREEVIVDQEKRNPTDFALWFFLTGRYTHHILHWSSPWGEGFPGWHIECSALVRTLLGQPIDIHTGGVDHIGTHHTNEIAQSEAAYDIPLAHRWMHNEFLSVDGKRMGKSEGNLITIDILQSHGFSPLDFRYLMLMAHYRSKVNFTYEALEHARRTRLHIRELIELGSTNSISAVTEETVWEALCHDLDTPRALALLHEAKSPVLWRHYDAILGLGLGVSRVVIPEKILSLQELRDQARQNKDWHEADRLRQEIEAAGYSVRDISEGSEIIPQ